MSILSKRNNPAGFRDMAAAAGIAIALLVMTGSANAQTYGTFGIRDESMQPLSINSSGVVAGYHVGRDDYPHGFIRMPDGTMTFFDVDGAKSTEPVAIQADGSVTGFYQNPDFSYHGFIREAGGTIISFDPPKSRGTFVRGAADAIVGTEEPKNVAKGFIRFQDGSYSTFRYPRAYDTEPQGINDAGAVVGIYRRIKTDQPHGFLRHPDGTFEVIVSHGPTWPIAINAGGVVVGNDNHEHVFVRATDGTITTFSVAGAVDILPAAINTGGTVVGFYLSDGQTEHGFLWTLQQGAVTLDVPHTTNTKLSAINDNGVMVGTCIDKHGHEVGFVRMP